MSKLFYKTIVYFIIITHFIVNFILNVLKSNDLSKNFITLRSKITVLLVIMLKFDFKKLINIFDLKKIKKFKNDPRNDRYDTFLFKCFFCRFLHIISAKKTNI